MYVGDMRRGKNGRLELWTGTRWINNDTKLPIQLDNAEEGRINYLAYYLDRNKKESGDGLTPETAFNNEADLKKATQPQSNLKIDR